MRADKAALAALLLLLAGFAGGLLFLARERYTRGDGYPAGSSYRTDPLGTRALHDALAEIDGVEVRRHTGPASHLTGGAGTVVLLLEVRDFLGSADPDLVRAVEAIALAGGRVVVSLETPEVRWFEDKKNEHEDRDKDGESEDGEEGGKGEKIEKGGRSGKGEHPDHDHDADRKPEGKEPAAGEEQAPPLPPPLSVRWGFASRPCPKEIAPTAAAVPVEGIGTDADLPWRGGDCLEELSSAWRPLWTRDGHVAVAERPLGRGTLVLLGDGYVLSNEALLFDRRPQALSLLLGRAGEVVFDESHHGVREQTGIASLLARYHLRGALLVLAMLFGLWAWWGASPLLPASRAADPIARAGREASAGLLSLLRRGLPPQRLVETCVGEWRKAFGRSRPAAAEALGRMTFGGRDLVLAWRRARETVDPGGRNDAR